MEGLAEKVKYKLRKFVNKIPDEQKTNAVNDTVTDALQTLFHGRGEGGENHADSRANLFYQNPHLLDNYPDVKQRAEQALQQVGLSLEEIPQIHELAKGGDAEQKRSAKADRQTVLSAFETILGDTEDGADDGIMSIIGGMVVNEDDELMGRFMATAKFILQRKAKEIYNEDKKLKGRGMAGDENGFETSPTQTYNQETGETETSGGIQSMDELRPMTPEARERETVEMAATIKPWIDDASRFSSQVTERLDKRTNETAQKVLSGELEMSDPVRSALTFTDEVDALSQASWASIQNVCYAERQLTRPFSRLNQGKQSPRKG